MRTSSTSKTKNTNAIRKNRIEKGRRALYLGVNPHSKGLIFSNSNTFFFLRDSPARNTNMTKSIRINVITTKCHIFLKTYLSLISKINILFKLSRNY